MYKTFIPCLSPRFLKSYKILDVAYFFVLFPRAKEMHVKRITIFLVISNLEVVFSRLLIRFRAHTK